MERVVNLRPDDSGQTLVCCRSPPASERQEYEAPSLSSCTGNEMWNEMSRYNRRAASLVHLLFRTDQRRDFLERLLSPSCLAVLSFIISTETSCVRREKCLCLFFNVFYFQIVQMIWQHFAVLSYLYSCFFYVILTCYAPVSYSAFSVLLSPELLM